MELSFRDRETLLMAISITTEREIQILRALTGADVPPHRRFIDRLDELRTRLQFEKELEYKSDQHRAVRHG